MYNTEPASFLQAGWWFYRLFFYKSMKLIFEFVKVRQEHVQFFLDVMMRYAMPESWMLLSFTYMKPDLVFQVMNIDKLNVKLVVKMFNAQQGFGICFPRGKII